MRALYEIQLDKSLTKTMSEIRHFEDQIDNYGENEAYRAMLQLKESRKEKILQAYADLMRDY